MINTQTSYHTVSEITLERIEGITDSGVSYHMLKVKGRFDNGKGAVEVLFFADKPIKIEMK